MDTHSNNKAVPVETAVTYRFGRVQFTPARYELRVDGKIVEVQRKPLEVLAVLLANAGDVITRQELVRAVWHDRPLVDNVVASAVTRLRVALGPEDANCVITHHRVGYRFTGHVERLLAEPPTPPSALQLYADKPMPGRATFLLETLLSRVGATEVWVARHPKTTERRVYKVCKGSEALSALEREVALMRVLRQTLGERADVVRQIDWNLTTPPYFVEYEFAGHSLCDWAGSANGLAVTTMSERTAMFTQIAEALAAVHSAGVLHKDIKPANILISGMPGRWRLRLADFGSGRLLTPERLLELGITQTPALMDGQSGPNLGSGTAMYLAPELFAGVAPTQQSDLYALGVVLYQLICGDFRRPLVPGWERNVADEVLRADVAAATDGDTCERLATVSQLLDRLHRLDERRALIRSESAGEEQRPGQFAPGGGADAPTRASWLRRVWLTRS